MARSACSEILNVSKAEKIVAFIIMFTCILYPFVELTRNIFNTLDRTVVYLTPLRVAIPELLYMFTSLVIFVCFLVYVLRRK